MSVPLSLFIESVFVRWAEGIIQPKIGVLIFSDSVHVRWWYCSMCHFRDENIILYGTTRVLLFLRLGLSYSFTHLFIYSSLSYSEKQ